MNCKQARELLDAVAGDELIGPEADAVRAHGAGCAECAAELSALGDTIGLLRRAGQEALPDGFTLSLRQALLAAPKPRRGLVDRLRATLVARPIGTTLAAAGLAALLATGGTLAWTAHARSAFAYRVPSSKVALVKVDFVAERDIEDVAFEITLPDGLRFVAGGQQLAERTFRFEGRLAAGSNPIPIAVKGPRAGRYKLIAHAIGPALDVTHEVVLEVTT